MALTGGTWIWLVERLPVPARSSTIVVVVGGAFSLAYLWLLVHRLRVLLAHPGRMKRELVLLAVNLSVLVVAFAWVHGRIGIMDATQVGPPRISHDFGDALYFSIVTLTTTGYGDFIPTGAGRALAGLQAIVGYLTMGILVSTGFRLIAPGVDVGPSDAHSAGEEGGPEEEEREE